MVLGGHTNVIVPICRKVLDELEAACENDEEMKILLQAGSYKELRLELRRKGLTRLAYRLEIELHN